MLGSIIIFREGTKLTDVFVLVLTGASRLQLAARSDRPLVQLDQLCLDNRVRYYLYCSTVSNRVGVSG
jgi:hypothetical protein